MVDPTIIFLDPKGYMSIYQSPYVPEPVVLVTFIEVRPVDESYVLIVPVMVAVASFEAIIITDSPPDHERFGAVTTDLFPDAINKTVFDMV